MQIQDLPVYVISLPQARQRRQQITQELHQAQLSFEFLDATDDRLPLSDAALSFIGGAKQLARYAPQQAQVGLEQGALGCLISHLRCYQKLLDSEHDCVLILEDDATLLDNFSTVLESVLKHAHLWNLLYLGHDLGHHIWAAPDPWFGKQHFPLGRKIQKIITLPKKPSNSLEKLYLGPPVVNIYGGHGYLINRQAAQLILAQHLDYIAPLECIMNSLAIPKRYLVLPRVINASEVGSGYIQGVAVFKAAQPVKPADATQLALNPQATKKPWFKHVLDVCCPLGSSARRLLRKTKVTIDVFRRTSSPGEGWAYHPLAANNEAAPK